MISYSDVEHRLFALLKETHPEQRRALASHLWSDVQRSQQQPVTIDNRALFLFHGAAKRVEVVGDWSYWQPASFLERIEHTDLFYGILQFATDARLQYKLIVDGQWINDPANSRTQAEGFGYNSEFWMPKYEDESMLTLPHDVPHGSVERVQFESQMLHSHREVFLYQAPRPAGAPTSPVPLLVVHDGAEALRLGRFHVILDHLIAEKYIPPVVAMFVSPQMRNDEYASSNQYIDFCAQEILPFAIREFEKRGWRIADDPHQRCMTGASLGGLLATKTVLRFPEAYGSVIAQSPSYWWNKGEIFRSPDMKNASKVDFVIQTGTICDAKDLASLMAQRLRLIGAHVDYFEYSQGHTWGNWRTTFAQGMRAWLQPRTIEHLIS